MRLQHLSLALFCTLAFCLSASAQNNDFDLSSQRSEKQEVNSLSKEASVQRDLVINPTPHDVKVDSGKGIDFSMGFSVRDRKGAFGNDLDFLQKNDKGVRLDIDFGERKASAGGVRPLSGAYRLEAGKKGISILGYDERGAYYGLQTLREILQNDACQDGVMPYVVIDDYPDLPYRGVVEGFYGTPWSQETRLSLIDFYGKYKMNTYLYGPKDDPYHSCPDWRKPYPEDEADNIRRLVEACNRNRVEFVWAIHPGQDIKWNEEDYTNLVNKFNMMYDLGVRSFAIFFDDISGEGTNPLKQTELLNRLNSEFVKAKGDVAPLTVCPTDYSRLWANPGPNGSLAIYGNTLDKDIKVFWTGDVVCSDLTPDTMEWLNSRIRRPGYYWWNFPVTDYARHIVMQGPVYGLDTTLTSDDLCGLVSNPMEYGEASKIALYGVADYTWNISSYRPLDNWERGIREIVPDASDAYRTFAIHSADTETGYRRDESWETVTFTLADYSRDKADALREEFERICRVPEEMEDGCANRALLSELRPWLDEFARLGERGVRAIELMELYREGVNDSIFWEKYVSNIMSPEQRKEYGAHKSGTLKLQPFYENAMDDLGESFLEKILGRKPVLYHGMSSFPNGKTILTKQMFDGDSTTYYTSGYSQGKGDWIGVDLGSAVPVSSVRILQGRNSVDDVDYFDHAVLECSEDGISWTPLIDSMKQRYVITWKGEPVDARYVRIRRLDSERRNYASVRVFEVNPVTAEGLGFGISSDGVSNVLNAFDSRIDTYCDSDGELVFGKPEGTCGYVFLFDRGASGKVTQYDAEGNTICETDIVSPYLSVRTCDSTASVKVSGKLRIFEIVPVSDKMK